MTTDQNRHTCPGCDIETVAAELTLLPLRLRPAGPAGSRFRLFGVPAEIRVCPRCGRIEFFATDLEKFA
jgi:ribosomal protein S27AE